MSTDSQSRKLARLIGPSLLGITASESFNAHIWAGSNAPNVFINGTLLFVCGLAIIQNHSIWCLRWPVTITLVGWGGLTVGLMRMAFPEFVLKQVRSAGGGGTRDVRLTAAMVGMVGAFLTARGYL